MTLKGVRLLLVDAPNLIRRIHAAVPAPDRAQKVEQIAMSSLASVRRALTQHAPTHVLCAFEAEGSTWRHAVNPEYKKDRPQLSDELRELYSRCRQAFEQDGVHCIHQAGMEADDIIASMATRAAELGAEVVILSTDTGQAQLLSDKIRQHDHFQARAITADTIRQKLGIRPAQLVDYFALVGDTSHSLQGVPGIGAKTAARLLDRYPDLDTIIEKRNEIGGRIAENIGQFATTALQTRRLVSLRTDIRIDRPLKSFRYQPPSE
jgi:5'-3' exonuclease